MAEFDDPDELLACINKEDIKYLHTGKISPYIFPEKRKIVHEKNLYHLIVRIFAFFIDKNGEVKYLIQKRSNIKKVYPNFYTDSASGHINYKKKLSFKDIIQESERELFEEMGVYAQKIKFYSMQPEPEESFEISYIFIALIDSNIHLNPKEVDIESSRFYSKDELSQLLKAKNFISITKKLWNIFINMDIINLFKEQPELDKKNRCALFIGRFQPFHYGHLHIIKTIVEENKQLKIGIGSSQEYNTKMNPFNFKERKSFITESLKKTGIDFKKITFYEIPDMYDAKKWVDNIFKIVGDFDIIYTPNEWIRNLFLGKKCEIVKPKYYHKDEFNGAYIRELISKNDNKWTELVPKPVIKLIEKIDGIERIKKLNRN